MTEVTELARLCDEADAIAAQIDAKEAEAKSLRKRQHSLWDSIDQQRKKLEVQGDTRAFLAANGATG